jgi:hypothetical protein
VFGEWVLTRWNEPAPTLAWARLPMLLLTLALGGVIYACAKRLGGTWGGLLCLSLYVTAPVFLAFGPLVHTDIAVTLFSLLTVWTLADVWQEPTRRRVRLFSLAFSGALLSKFSAGILLLAFVAVALSLRGRPLPGQPLDPAESRLWRRRRSRAVWRGIGGAAVCVYAVYFVLCWNQSTDALDLLGHGSLIVPLRRLLMPPWLYLRGLLMMAVTSSRPTFMLGHQYPHGVWFYFPVLLLLKSPLGFTSLLGLAGIAAIVKCVANRANEPGLVESECSLRWRALWVSLLVFTAVCLASRLNISFRHFSVPLVLLILLMAPLPRLLEWVRERSALGAGLATALVAGLVLACFVTVVRAYPHYLPYISPLGLGRPGYVLVNDSNLDFNHALPEVARFAERHRLSRVPIDAFGLSDTQVVVPSSVLWNCQRPMPSEAGQWVIVSASMIQSGHNCLWLMSYPHEALAGGSMYAISLPPELPRAGEPGGPPLPESQYEIFGFKSDVDMRLLFLDVIRHPEKVPEWAAQMRTAMSRRGQTSAPPNTPAGPSIP